MSSSEFGPLDDPRNCSVCGERTPHGGALSWHLSHRYQGVAPDGVSEVAVRAAAVTCSRSCAVHFLTGGAVEFDG